MMLILPFVAFLITVSDADDVSYVCDFEQDTCGFTNDENMPTRWVRENVELGGKEGYVMSLKYNGTTDRAYVFGRVFTPYFGILEEQPGCFNFDFFVSGNGLRFFTLDQETNTRVFAAWVYGEPQQGWQKSRTRVNIDAATRFFFTVVIDPSIGDTTIAIDNMALNLKPC